ncbi:hypothetical protein Tco_0919961 [Tanacetum coccineum]
MESKDSKIVTGKGERKCLALKAKKVSSDEESSTSRSEEEEYAKGLETSRSSSIEEVECPKPPRDKTQRAFVGGSWSDSGEEDDEKAKDETCLMAYASSELQDMSTSNTHQQSLANAGSETRPPMLDRGPYEFKEFTSSETKEPRMQKEEDLRGDDLKHYEAETKKLEKSHDPLALVAHTGSSSRTTSPYYVTHPSTVVDYDDDDYQGDAVQNTSEEPLTSAMILLARAITQRFSNPTNNHLCTSSNTRNQAIIQGDRVNIQSRNSGNDGRNTTRSYVQEEIIEGNNVQNDAGNIQRTL